MNLKQVDNQVVADAFLNKDESLMSRFYQSEWPGIRYALMQMGGSEEDAKDVMQRGFITLYDKIRSGKYENRTNAKISTYFQNICRYEMLNHLRAAHKLKTEDIELLKYNSINITLDEEEDDAGLQKRRKSPTNDRSIEGKV